MPVAAASSQSNASNRASWVRPFGPITRLHIKTDGAGSDVIQVATPPARGLQQCLRSDTARRGARSEGFIVLGWLTRIIIGLTLLGVFAFDALSVGSASLTVSDAANGAAIAGRDAYNNSPINKVAAFNAAQKFATEHGAILDASHFSISQDGRVTVTVTKVAHTVVLEHIPPLSTWTVRSATATSGKVGS